MQYYHIEKKLKLQFLKLKKKSNKFMNVQQTTYFFIC